MNTFTETAFNIALGFGTAMFFTHWVKMWKRNDEVSKFRMRVLLYSLDLYMMLPTYWSMLWDGKELTIENYIDSKYLNQ